MQGVNFQNRHKDVTRLTKVNKKLTTPLTSKILELLGEGKYAEQIALDLKITPACVSGYIKKLKKRGLIKDNYRTNYKIYDLTEAGLTSMELAKVNHFSQGTSQGVIRAHNIRVTLPLVKDAEVPWETHNFKNWSPKHRDTPILGCSITKTTKSIVLNLKAREFIHPDQIMGHIFNIVVMAVGYLHDTYGIECRLREMKVSNKHLAIPSIYAEQFVNDGLYPSLNLGRECEKMTPNDPPKQAWAWIDASEGPPEVESNDIAYPADFLAMPERIKTMFKALMFMADNQVSHVELIRTLNEQAKVNIKTTSEMLKVLNRKTRMNRLVKRIRQGQTILEEFV